MRPETMCACSWCKLINQKFTWNITTSCGIFVNKDAIEKWRKKLLEITHQKNHKTYTVVNPPRCHLKCYCITLTAVDSLQNRNCPEPIAAIWRKYKFSEFQPLNVCTDCLFNSPDSSINVTADVSVLLCSAGKLTPLLISMLSVSKKKKRDAYTAF